MNISQPLHELPFHSLTRSSSHTQNQIIFRLALLEYISISLRTSQEIRTISKWYEYIIRITKIHTAGYILLLYKSKQSAGVNDFLNHFSIQKKNRFNRKCIVTVADDKIQPSSTHTLLIMSNKSMQNPGVQKNVSMIFLRIV